MIARVRPWLEVVGVSAWLLACGAGQSKPTATPQPAAREPAGEAAPAPGQRWIDVESGPFALHRVHIPELGITANVESSAPPEIVTKGRAAKIDIPYGDETAFSCTVTRAHLSGGRLAREIAQKTLAALAIKHAWIDVHGDHEAGWPFVLARALFSTRQAGAEVAVDYKLAISVRRDVTLVCVLVASGNYAAFERALRTFLGSLQVAGGPERATPFYEAIVRSSDPGREVTITYEARYESGGQTSEESTAIYLSIEREDELYTSDGDVVEVFREGKLIRASHKSHSNLELDWSIELELQPDGYRVSGTSKNQPVAGHLPLKDSLIGGKVRRAQNCDVRDGRLARAEESHHDFANDPLATQTLVVEKATVAHADLRVTFPGKPMEMLVKLDANCEAERFWLTRDGGSSESVRIWSAGRP